MRMQIFIGYSILFQEKELLRKKQEEIKADEEAKRKRVVVAFDLVGRRVCCLALLLYDV